MSLLGVAAFLQILALALQLFESPSGKAGEQAAARQEVSSGAAPTFTESPAKDSSSPAAAITAVPSLPAPQPVPNASDSSTPAAGAEATAAATASPEEALAAEAEQQLLALQAEKRLIATLPKPTPIPRRAESPMEARLNGLLHLARALRDRGDTSTALTRLREAQVISPENPQIIAEMAVTYEKMGLFEKATEQWRRIYAIGEKAGIYYTAAEAKLAKLRQPGEAAYVSDTPEQGSLLPGAEPGEKVLSLGQVGTTDDTGNSEPLRRLKLRIPIQARPGAKIDVHEVVIQVFFYDQLEDGSVVETNANVVSSWARRTGPDGSEAPVDWRTPEPEVLEVEYAQEPAAPPSAPAKGSKGRRKPQLVPERRNYFGYVVRVYYKGDLNASHAEPEKLLTQFPPPVTLQPSSDLPQ